MPGNTPPRLFAFQGEVGTGVHFTALADEGQTPGLPSGLQFPHPKTEVTEEVEIKQIQLLEMEARP